MTDKIDDGGPAFAVWESWSINNYAYGTIVARSDKTFTVQPWRNGKPDEWENPTRKMARSVIPVASQQEAEDLCKAVRELNDREDQTRRQYAEKRKALVEAARAKGGAK